MATLTHVKNRSRATAVVAVAALALSACTGDADDPDDAGPPAGDNQTQTTPEPEPEPTEDETSAVPSADELDLTCSFEQNDLVTASLGDAYLEGVNSADAPYPRLEVQMRVSGPDGEIEFGSFVNSFLPGEELAQLFPVSRGDAAEDAVFDTCEVLSVNDPGFHRDNVYDPAGATCAIKPSGTRGYWDYEVDMAAVAGFPASADVSMEIAFMVNGKRYHYHSPSLAAGDTAYAEIVGYGGDGELECAVRSHARP